MVYRTKEDGGRGIGELPTLKLTKRLKSIEISIISEFQLHQKKYISMHNKIFTQPLNK